MNCEKFVTFFVWYLTGAREYFKINRQIGYSPTTMYDFQFKADGNKLYKLSLFANIQKSNDASEDFRNFQTVFKFVKLIEI